MHRRPPPTLLLLIPMGFALTQLTGCDGCTDRPPGLGAGQPPAEADIHPVAERRSPEVAPEDPEHPRPRDLPPGQEGVCQRLCAAAVTCADPCTVDAVRCQRRCIAEDWAAPADGGRDCRTLGRQLAHVSPPLLACTPGALDPGQPGPSKTRVCSSHTISIDFPLGDFPTEAMTALQPRVVGPSVDPLTVMTVWMREDIEGAAQRWLDDRLGASAGPIRVEIEPLFEIEGLPKRGPRPGVDTGYAARYGWEAFRLRHWRLTVVGSKLDAPVPIPDALLCAFLANLRAWVQQRIRGGLQGASPAAREVVNTAPYIARECDASRQDQDVRLRPSPEPIGGRPGVPPIIPPALGPFEDPSRREALWHLYQLYAPDIPPARPASVQGQGEVQLAILDTPISIADARSLSATAPQAGPATRTHPHALAMGLFARQLAPRAKVSFYEALDSNAGTPIGNTAVALERMLSDRGWVPHLEGSRRSDDPSADSPVVVNLSLGWPPEYGEATEIRDCREDPVGESVHTMLRMMEALRDEGSKPILVFAAAGNRALPLAFVGDGREFVWMPRFYPAQWGFSGGGALRLPQPITATARTPLALNASSDWTRGAMALPGIDVPVPSHPDLEPGLRRMTGTSVSTILMSALAAEIGEGLTLGQSQPAVDWMSGIKTSACADGTVPSFKAYPSDRNCPSGDPAATAGETFAPPPAEDVLAVGAEFIVSAADSRNIRSPDATVDRWAAGSFTSQPDIIICPGGDCRLHFARRSVNGGNPTLREAYVEAPLTLPSDSNITNVRLDMEWDPTPGANVGDLAAKSIKISDGGSWLLQKGGRLMRLPAGIFPPAESLPTASFRLSFDLKRGAALTVKRDVWLKGQLHDSP